MLKQRALWTVVSPFPPSCQICTKLKCTCPLTPNFVLEAAPWTKRWSDNQEYGGTTTSQEIDAKFFDCTFHVNPGETSLQLFAAIQKEILLQMMPLETVERQRRIPTESSSWYHLRGNDYSYGSFVLEIIQTATAVFFCGPDVL